MIGNTPHFQTTIIVDIDLEALVATLLQDHALRALLDDVRKTPETIAGIPATQSPAEVARLVGAHGAVPELTRKNDTMLVPQHRSMKWSDRPDIHRLGTWTTVNAHAAPALGGEAPLPNVFAPSVHLLHHVRIMPPLPRPHDDNSNNNRVNGEEDRAARLAAMSSNANTMSEDRQKRLAALLEKEKAEMEADERARARSGGMSGFLSQEQKRVFGGMGGLEDRIKRGRGGLVVDAD